jgi:hypothetical protein
LKPIEAVLRHQTSSRNLDKFGKTHFPCASSVWINKIGLPTDQLGAHNRYVAQPVLQLRIKPLQRLRLKNRLILILLY